MPMRSVIDRIGHGYYKQHYNYGMANIIFYYMRDNIEEKEIAIGSKWSSGAKVWTVTRIGVTYVDLRIGTTKMSVGKQYFKTAYQELTVGKYYERV